MIGMKDAEALTLATLLKECYEGGEMYLSRQLAEECTEFAQSVFKLVRAENGETPVSVEDAQTAMFEELADVILCADLCCAWYKANEPEVMKIVEDIMEEKKYRTLCRVIEARKGAIR